VIINLFHHKLATEPVNLDGSQRSRLTNMRLAKEKRQAAAASVTHYCDSYERSDRFLDRVRAFEHLHGRAFRRKAMQYWFQPEADTYSCLFENVFTNTLSHLDALASAGYDSLLEAEQRWDDMPEKQIETFRGGFWIGDGGSGQPLALPGEATRPFLAIERKD